MLKFKVTGEKCPFWLKVKVKLRKPIPATSKISRPEFETVNKIGFFSSSVLFLVGFCCGGRHAATHSCEGRGIRDVEHLPRKYSPRGDISP